MTTIITVCSRCGSTLRQCSPRCTMGGWVHMHSERHLCRPELAYMLLARPDMWDRAWMFAHPHHVSVSKTDARHQ